MRYAVIDSNGVIVRTGNCVPGDLNLQPGEGQIVKQIDTSISDLTHRWVDGEFLEIEPIAEDIAPKVRLARKILLKSCDWTQMPDSPLTDSKKTEWRTYRQVLRDLPTHSNWPELADSDWPTPPT